MPFRLLWRSLLAHPLRSSLTAGSVAVAVFLICVLHGAITGLTKTLEEAATNRLVVQSAVSLFVDLPLAYQGKLQAVDGVEAVCKWQWFGGRYEREKGGFFAQFAVDPETFLTTYPEIAQADGSFEDFTRRRNACIVGQDLAKQYGWRVGDTVPLAGTIFPRQDGRPWEFEIAALYRSAKASIDENTMYFHYDYLRESLEGGGAEGGQGVGVYVLRLAPGADAVHVAATVDAMFASGPQRTQTSTEAEFNRQFVTMMGDVPAMMQMVGGAVLFAIFFAVLNTMIMAGRERTRDVGVLKALGFPDLTATLLLVGESVLLCAAGALLGLAFVKAIEAPFRAVMSRFTPGFEFDLRTLGLGAALALSIGLVAGLVPGLRAGRLRVVAALREVA